MTLDHAKPLLLPLALLLAFETWARATGLQSDSLAPPSAVIVSEIPKAMPSAKPMLLPMASPAKVGAGIMLAQQALRSDLMLAYLVWIGAIGYALNMLLNLAQRRLFGRAALSGDSP